MSLKEIIRSVETDNYPVFTLGERVYYVNEPNEFGETALMSTAAQGKTKLVEKLLIRGANPNAKDNYGRTALIWAIIKKQEKIAEILINNSSDQTVRDHDHQSPALLAAANGCLKTLKLLHASLKKWEEQRDKNGNTCLHWAAQKGQQAVLEYLLKKGSHINTRNYFGATALILAATQGHTETVRFLLSKGADTRIIDNLDKNALMRAKENNHLTIASLILEATHGNVISMASVSTKKITTKNKIKTITRKKSKVLVH